MYDSRMITKFFKKNDEQTVTIEFQDKLTPNTFELTKTGKIQSSVYGAYSNIIVKTIVYRKGQFNEISFAIHPDRLALICEKILKENYEIFKRPNSKFKEIGFVNKTIYTNKLVDSKFESSYLNIYLADEEKFVIKTNVGKADLIKDEFNRNDFENFESTNKIAVFIPIDDMELMAFQLIKYLEDYRSVIMSLMLDGRNLYEKRCRTMFKDVKGDPKKVRQIEEKFLNLSEEDRMAAEKGKLSIKCDITPK